MSSSNLFGGKSQTKEFRTDDLAQFYNGQIKFLDVPRILDFAEDSGILLAQSLKASGIPFIIKGHFGWAKFA